MIIAQKLYRRSRVSRTKKILQHRRQDQGHRKRIQRNQWRTKSRLESEIGQRHHTNHTLGYLIRNIVSLFAPLSLL